MKAIEQKAKAYTDIEQSKKLAEILPLETADAWLAERYEGKVTSDGQYIVNEEPFHYISFIKPSETNYSQDTVKDIPCWSLAALLDYLKPNIYLEHEAGVGWKVSEYVVIENPNSILSDIKCVQGFSEDNSIDACVELVLKLHKQNLL